MMTMEAPLLRSARVQLADGPASIAVRIMHGLPTCNVQTVWERDCCCLVVAGEGRFRDAAGERRIGPGDIFWHPRGCAHHIERTASEAWREWSLTVDGGLGDLLVAAGLYDRHQAVWPGRLAPRRAAWRRLLGAVGGEPGAGSPLAATIGFLSVVRQAALDPWQAAADQLAADVGAKLDLEVVAASVALGPVQFRRRFRQRFGCSPRLWRDRARMLRARDLLRDEGLSVTAVADLLGYATPFAFSRRFRAVLGVPPSRCG